MYKNWIKGCEGKTDVVNIRKRSNCLFHEVSSFCHHHFALVYFFYTSSAVRCETEVKQAGSHLMYLCCWLTLGPVITLLLYSVNKHIHPYKGMILQLPPRDIWQVNKLKFLDMYFNQDYIKTAPCAWTFSVHMSSDRGGLGNVCSCSVCCFHREVLLFNIHWCCESEGHRKRSLICLWMPHCFLLKQPPGRWATATSCCAQTNDNRWHTQIFTHLLTVAPTQTNFAYVCCSEITPISPVCML